MEEEIEAMIGAPEWIYQFKQHVMEEHWAQWIYIALASLLLVVASSPYIGSDEKRPDSIASTEVGAWLMPISQ